MAIQATKISWWDCLLLQLRLTVPSAFRGLVAANRLFFGPLCRLNADEWAVRTLDALRRKYRSSHLWIWFPFGSTLLVLERESMEAVLKSADTQADPTIKRCPLSRFIPEALVISRGEAWSERRSFNERVLDSGDLHRHADAFKDIVFREVEQLTGTDPVATLRWADFEKLGERISHQLILGSGQVNSKMAGALAHMVGLSNLCLPSARAAAFYRDLGAYLMNPAAASLVQRASAEARDTTAPIPVPSQIGFWFFVLKDAVELHVARTLALIAVHPSVQERLRTELVGAAAMTARAIDDLDYLGACLGEQLRLWTPVPILLRRAEKRFALRGEIPIEAEQQVMLHTGFYHRDPDVFGAKANRFSPDSIGADFPPVYVFSAHRQSCAGQSVARFVLKAALAALLRRFRFELLAPRLDPDRLPYSYDHFKLELRAVRAS
jgi:cytochrome P450